MELTDDEHRANAVGLLAPGQRRRLESEERRFWFLALGSAALVPLVLWVAPLPLAARVPLGALCLALIVLFGLLARESHRACTAPFPLVFQVAGPLTIQESSGSHRAVFLGGKTFFIVADRAERLEAGQSYAFYFVLQPHLLLGWRRLE
jgi:hypothetical protein